MKPSLATQFPEQRENNARACLQRRRRQNAIIKMCAMCVLRGRCSLSCQKPEPVVVLSFKNLFSAKAFAAAVVMPAIPQKCQKRKNGKIGYFNSITLSRRQLFSILRKIEWWTAAAGIHLNGICGICRSSFVQFFRSFFFLFLA